MMFEADRRPSAQCRRRERTAYAQRWCRRKTFSTLLEQHVERLAHAEQQVLGRRAAYFW